MKKLARQKYLLVILLINVCLVFKAGFLFGQGTSVDDRWYDQFFLGGFDGEVHAVAIAPNGDIYVGGYFKLINGIHVSGIAMWDGTKWNSLQGGVSGGWNNAVYDIVIDQGNVFVGGDFTMAGSVEANRIAMWDGTEWHSLGTGVDNEVHTIATDGGNVYIGGYGITDAGGIAVNNVAKWDGLNWSAMGSGVTNYNYVETMVAKDDTVYVGGNFKKAGVDTVNYVTFWDGVKWNKMNNGMSGRVYDLAFGDGVLYAAGNFNEAGGNTARYIAQWDGQNWSEVGNGLNSTAYSMFYSGNNLYVGGRFIMADTTNAARIVKWDGEKWNPLGAGVEDPDQVLGYWLNAIAVDGEKVYIGGNFSEAGGNEINDFACWDGQSWSGLGVLQDQSVNGPVNAIALDGNNVYVGGQFVKAGGDTVNNIAKWDGQQWSSLGDGLNGAVSALLVNDGHVFAGGFFTQSGDTPLMHIAEWDGEKWNSLSAQGMNGGVSALTFFGGDLYAGGSFTSAGNKWARRIARWDGAEWHALGGDGSLSGAAGLDGWVGSYVTSMQAVGDTLYIGGHFGRAYYMDGGSFVRVQSMAKWDGQSWFDVKKFDDLIVDQIVYSFFVKEGIIYAAGSFPRSGQVPAQKVVKLEGNQWIDVGDEMYNSASSYSNAIHSVIEQDGTIYAGGQPDMVGDKEANHVVMWDGTGWNSLGSGVNNFVNTLASNSNYLYVGGNFSMAGGKGSAYLARYDLSNVTALEKDYISVSNSTLYQNYPNPFYPITTIAYHLESTSYVTLKIFDAMGREIRELVHGLQGAGTYQATFNAASLSDGLYFYTLTSGNKVVTNKMIVKR